MAIKFKTKNLLKSVPYTGYLYLSLCINIIVILTILIIKSWLPPIVPLLYGEPGGAIQLVPVLGLLIAPGLAILVTIVNSLLSLKIQDLFLKKVLIIISFLITLLTTVTFLKIIFLVGFF